MTILRPILAAAVLGIASAPMLLALAEPAQAPQRAVHVALQSFQFTRTRTAMALTGTENTPGAAPARIVTSGPAAPGYIWRLTGDVPSAPSLLHRFEADPVRVVSYDPVQPGSLTN